MLSNKEFVDWLRGFVAASSKHNLSTEGWDTIRKKLEEVYDDEMLDILRDPNTFRVHPIYPPDPLKWYNPNGDPVSPPYFVGDQPGWLTGPWQVSCTAGDISPTTSTSTAPKQESNE